MGRRQSWEFKVEGGFNHAPYGATVDELIRRGCAVQSTPLVWGATRGLLRALRNKQRFNPRPRMGGDALVTFSFSN